MPTENLSSVKQQHSYAAEIFFSWMRQAQPRKDSCFNTSNLFFQLLSSCLEKILSGSDSSFLGIFYISLPGSGSQDIRFAIMFESSTSEITCDKQLHGPHSAEELQECSKAGISVVVEYR